LKDRSTAKMATTTTKFSSFDTPPSGEGLCRHEDFITYAYNLPVTLVPPYPAV